MYIMPIQPVTSPITPAQVGALKADVLPDAVLEAFNRQIAIAYNQGEARVKQSDVVDDMVALGLDRDDIYAKGWLNVEEAYRSKGWKVVYDKPVAYAGESYPPVFIFST